MKTVYKHFKFECSNSDCGHVVSKLFDVSKTEDILGYIYCDKCGQDTLKCLESTERTESRSAGIIGEGDRWTKKLDPDFKYIMKQMKKRHPRANIPDY